MYMMPQWKTINNNSEEHKDKSRALLGREEVRAIF